MESNLKLYQDVLWGKPQLPTTNHKTTMAHRLLVQVVFTGAKVFGRAFSEAYKQAAAATTAQQATGNAKQSATSSQSRDGSIALDEACKILNVDTSGLSMDAAQKKYDYLFDINSKENGGSFYVQSKVYRAMERIKTELDYIEEFQKEREAEKQNGEDTGSGKA